MALRGGGPPADWLVVGLGNPGSQYEHTPHNVGFLVVRELASRWDLGRPRSKYRSDLWEGRARLTVTGGAGSDGISGDGPGSAAGGAGASGGGASPRVAVMTPQTFMNESGRAVGPARGAMKVPLHRVLVVHDEIDLRFADVRWRLGGGLAGHNGLKSLKRELGDAAFGRVRVGVGRPDSTDPEIVSAYVLGRWRQPATDVEDLVRTAADACERIVGGELELAAAR